MQAVSGAGYPGVPSLDILGNVIPFIGDEEPKIESEIQKFLGTRRDGTSIARADSRSARTPIALPVEHGHTVCMSIELRDASRRRRRRSSVLREWRGDECARGLPSAPERPLDRHRRARSPAAAARRRRGRRHDGHRRSRPRRSDLRRASSSRWATTSSAAPRARRCSTPSCSSRRDSLPDSRDRLQVRRHLGRRRRGDRAHGRHRAHARRERQPIVVVSALGGVTNALLAHRASRRRRDISSVRCAASRRCASGTSSRRSCCSARSPRRGRHLRRDERDVRRARASRRGARDARRPHAAHARRDRGVRRADVVAARASRRSSTQGFPAVHVDACEVMITDDDVHAAPSRSPTRSPRRAATSVMPLVRDGKVPVMGGFIGVARRARGHDDAGARRLRLQRVAGRCRVQADAIEIWTDVDGMLTADPRVVPDARLIEQIAFDEASELASFGAKVLHPNTIAPAVRLGIPVFDAQLAASRGQGNADHVRRAAPRRERDRRARATSRSSRCASPRMLLTEGFLRALFEIFERHRTSVDVVATSEVSRLGHASTMRSRPRGDRGRPSRARRRVGRAKSRHRRGRRRRIARRRRRHGARARGARRRPRPHAVAQRDRHQPHDGRRRRAGDAGDAAAARRVLRTRSLRHDASGSRSSAWGRWGARSRSSRRSADARSSRRSTTQTRQRHHDATR